MQVNNIEYSIQLPVMPDAVACLQATKQAGLESIPVLSYANFFATVLDMLHEPGMHCAGYDAQPEDQCLRLVATLYSDMDNTVHALSWKCPAGAISLPRPALATQASCMKNFELALHNNWGMAYKAI